MTYFPPGCLELVPFCGWGESLRHYRYLVADRDGGRGHIPPPLPARGAPGPRQAPAPHVRDEPGAGGREGAGGGGEGGHGGAVSGDPLAGDSADTSWRSSKVLIPTKGSPKVIIRTKGSSQVIIRTKGSSQVSSRLLFHTRYSSELNSHPSYLSGLTCNIFTGTHPYHSVNVILGSVADPDPVGSGLFGSPGSGSGKKIYGRIRILHPQ